ncbi:MAG: hypothetical protein CMJ18_08030 [Phycisphaeraceae bacterium]|nr:hypothetical protein [Phycisphaeraceae bacterium]
MRPRPLILNDDGAGQFTYLKPPVKRADLHAMVDKVVGTAVTTLCVTLFDGRCGWHDSPHFTHLGEMTTPLIAGPIQARQRYVFRSLREQGIDPLEVFAQRAHEQGLTFIASMRMNDAHFAYYRGINGDGPWNCPSTSDFWKQNQHLLLDGEFGYFEHLLDYAHQATRDYRLAQIEDVCRRYDVDGIELDFVRHPHYFKRGQAGRHADRMTDLVRAVRAMMDDAGRERGRRLQLQTLVPRTISGCEHLGLDVRTWMQDGLINAVIPKNFIHFEQDMPVREWGDLAETSDTAVYPCFERGTRVEEFRAGAARYYRDGATGLYFYNFWNFGVPFNDHGRQILSETSDETMLATQDKHYVVFGGGGCAQPYTYEEGEPPAVPLPARIARHGGASFKVDVADDIAGASSNGTLHDVTLRITTDRPEPALRLLFNWDMLDTTTLDDGLALEAAVPADVVNPGMYHLNHVRVENHCDDVITIVGVEVRVRYHGANPPAEGAIDERPDSRVSRAFDKWRILESTTGSVPLILDTRDRVEAEVTVTDTERLRTARTVRFELRTPRTNERGYEYHEHYGRMPSESDRYEARLNGVEVGSISFIDNAYGSAAAAQPGDDFWFCGIYFDVPASIVTPGPNALSLQLTERDPDVRWGLVLVDIDLLALVAASGQGI